jgi:predicted permease
MWLLFAAVTVVQAIACANVSGFMLTLMSTRCGEIGVRTALGAGTKDIVRQILAECLTLGLSGAVGGAIVATVLTHLIMHWHPSSLWQLEEIRPNAFVFLFAFAWSAISGGLAAIAPALYIRRLDVSSVLKAAMSHAEQSNWAGVSRLRGLLVVGEISLALTVLVATALLARTVMQIRAVDPGFKAAGLVTMTVPLSPVTYATAESQTRFVERLLEQLKAAPGIESAAISNSLPLASRLVVTTEMQCAGQTTQDATVFLRAISADYFQTMGIAVIRGRNLTAEEYRNGGAIMVNRAAAKHFWPAMEPIGRTVRLAGETKPRIVVGVVENVKNLGILAETGREAYVPFAAQPAAFVGVAVRMQESTRARLVTAGMRQAVKNVDANQAIEPVTSMQETVDAVVAPRRFTLSLVSGFALLASALAILGVAGIVAQSVTARSREIGIRIALGSSNGAVLWLVVRRSVGIAGIGIGLGSMASIATATLLRSVLYGVEPHDPLLLIACSLALLGACALASYGPARRAIRIDPNCAIRQ